MANFLILESVRLTGEIVSGELELISHLDLSTDTGTLDVNSDFDPVRVELHDFTDSSSNQWQFITSTPWTRGTGLASADFYYTSGESYQQYTVVAQQAGTSTQKTKTLYIKVKPVVSAPDRF